MGSSDTVWRGVRLRSVARRPELTCERWYSEGRGALTCRVRGLVQLLGGGERALEEGRGVLDHGWCTSAYFCGGDGGRRGAGRRGEGIKMRPDSLDGSRSVDVRAPNSLKRKEPSGGSGACRHPDQRVRAAAWLLVGSLGRRRLSLRCPSPSPPSLLSRPCPPSSSSWSSPPSPATPRSR